MAKAIESMREEKRNRLIQLGPECLAETLLALGDRDPMAADKVERLIGTPQQNVKRFRSKLSGLKRMRRFVDSRGVFEFAEELEALLEDLREGVSDPRIGVELVAGFYGTDHVVFEHCDDSSGCVGTVFRGTACDLFVSYASQCPDKDWLCELIVKIVLEDEYGVRDALIENAFRYLPKKTLRSLVDKMWHLSELEKDGWRAQHWLFRVACLARQLKDASLYEKAIRAAWPDLPTAACLDIGRVYLETGNAETALSWLERIPIKETFQADKRDELLLVVYQHLDQNDKLVETAWRIFRRYRSVETLATLLSAIGEERRHEVVEEETRCLLQSKGLSYGDALFLIEVGRTADAEEYLLCRADKLNGDRYDSLLPLAEGLEEEGRFLVASVIYRSLLDSILRRGVSKYYHHGVRYLKRLDGLAGKIDDWPGVLQHNDYKSELSKTHGRKVSFWSRYKG